MSCYILFINKSSKLILETDYFFSFVAVCCINCSVTRVRMKIVRILRKCDFVMLYVPVAHAQVATMALDASRLHGVSVAVVGHGIHRLTCVTTLILV